MHMTLPKFRFIPESARIAYRKKAATSSVVTGDNVMLKKRTGGFMCLHLQSKNKRNVQANRFVA